MARTNAAAQLELRQRVQDRELLELGIAQLSVGMADRVQVGLLGGPPVESQDPPPLAARDDGGEGPELATVPDPDRDRCPRHERDGDDAVVRRPAGRELRRLIPRGRAHRRVGAAPGEPNAWSDNLVCAGDELCVEARVRVVEQEQQGLARLRVDAGEGRRGGSPGRAARIVRRPFGEPDADVDVVVERQRGAAGGRHRARGDDAVARHPRPRNVGRGCRRLLDGGLRSERRRRKDENEACRPRQPVQCLGHGVAHGVCPIGDARCSEVSAQCRCHAMTAWGVSRRFPAPHQTRYTHQWPVANRSSTTTIGEERVYRRKLTAFGRSKPMRSGSMRDCWDSCACSG